MNSHNDCTVVKAKSIETNHISICSPRSIIDGKSYTYNVMYAAKKLTIQLPRCQLFTGLYESDGKCYCEIAIPTHGVTNEMYFDIALQLQQLLRKENRFKDVTFVGHIRKTIDNFSCLRLKLPQNKSQVLTDIVSMDNNTLPFSKFVKGATIIPIVSIEHAYVINDTLGFNFLLKQIVIIE